MKKLWILLLVMILGFTGCSSSPTTHEFFAMDTVMYITLYENREEWLNQAQQQVVELDSLFSVTKSSSEIYSINTAQGTPVKISPQTATLIQTAQNLHKETNGLFDITVYPAVKAWGFTQNQNRVPTTKELEQLLPSINSKGINLKETTVTLPKNAQLDLGGIAKGYAADVVAQQLINNGCKAAVLSFGGNVKTLGQKPDGSLFTVAVQDPLNTEKTLGILSVSGGTAVVTSGDSQRYFEQDGVKYHHIIDPRTAAPAMSDLSSVTVVCSSATRADAFATALYIMGLQDGLAFINQKEDVEALFVTKQGEIHLSDGLQNTFTSNQ